MKRAFVVMTTVFFMLLFGFVFAEPQPWDFLRPLNSAAESLSAVTTWVVFLLSLGLMVIALLAYRRKHSKRYAFIALAFVFFFLKWLLKVVDIYFSPGHFFNWAAESVFELVIFASLFLALFKR